MKEANTLLDPVLPIASCALQPRRYGFTRRRAKDRCRWSVAAGGGTASRAYTWIADTWRVYCLDTHWSGDLVALRDRADGSE